MSDGGAEPDIIDPQHNDMSSAAYRKTHPRLGTPSISWHRAFWKPPELTRERWQANLDDRLCDMFVRLNFEAGLANSSENNSGPESICENYIAVPASESRSAGSAAGTLSLFKHKYDFIYDASGKCSRPPAKLLKGAEQLFHHAPFCFVFRFGGVWITILAELHTEYWTLTTFLDMSGKHLPARTEGNLVKESELLHNIAVYLRRAEEVVCNRANLPPAKTVDEEQKRIAAIDRQFADMREELIDPSRRLIDLILGMDALDPLETGGLFAGPVGVVLGVKPIVEASSESVRRYEVVPDPKSLVGTAQRVSADIRFQDQDAVKIVAAAWPIVRWSSFQKTNMPKASKPGYTASLFQGRRAIYLSTLGEVLPAGSASQKISVKPIIYFIISCHQNRWQIGRLVGRLHAVGTLRMAAVRDIAPITTVHRRIRAIQKGISRGDYDAIGKQQNLVDAFEGINLDRVARQHVVHGQRSLLITTGIEYRVDRFNYYYDEFKETLKKLRQRRIEGFLPYDQLVFRRMGNTFKFIRMFGARHKELIEQVQVSQRMIQAVQTNLLLDNADKVLFVIVWNYAIDIFEALGKYWKSCPRLAVWPNFHVPDGWAEAVEQQAVFFAFIAAVAVALFLHAHRIVKLLRWLRSRFPHHQPTVGEADVN